MPIPAYVAGLRAHLGHRLLWLVTARTVAIDETGRVLLGRFPGAAAWTIPGGVIDPGEEPADAAVRECYEETGVIAIPGELTSVTVSGLVTHDSGDLTQHLDFTFRCRAAGGHARPCDGELEEAGWFNLDTLPEVERYELDLVTRALGSAGQASYTFSGLEKVLGPGLLPASRGSARPK